MSLTAEKKKQIISEVTAKLARESKTSPARARAAKFAKLQKKEASVASAMSAGEPGMRKLGANLASPVREKLDYQAIFRQLTITEQWPDGVPMVYDKDFPEAVATKIGSRGSTREVVMEAERVTLTEFEIVTRPKVPYKELYQRRFKSMERAKDRLVEGLGLREDLYGFSLIETAFTAGSNTIQTISGDLTKAGLAAAFNEVEKNRLVVRNVLMSTYGIRDIRGWEWETIDQAGLQEIRETGYLGRMWNANFYVSDQITAGTIYVLATPKFLSWMPFRKDAQIIAADDPDNLWLGFVGYELLGLTVHNGNGVGKLTFTA